MTTATSTLEKLDHTSIDDVPHNQLYRLEEPLEIADQVAAQTDECVLVTDLSTLSLEIRAALAEAVENPNMAFISIRVRNLVLLVYLKDTLENDRTGFVWASGDQPPTSPGAKRTITPSPLTAKAVKSVSKKAGDLPKALPIVLAANYQCVSSDGVVNLFPITDEEVPEPTNMPVGIRSFLSEALFLKKGTIVTLSEQDGQLTLTKHGSKDPTAIAPNSELSVFIPVSRKFN